MRLLARMAVLMVGVLPGLSACAGRTSARPVVPAATAAGAPLRVPGVGITGLIVNGVTSRPLRGATIELDGNPRAASGPDGRFRIDDVSIGMHLLSTKAAKFRARIQPVSIVVADADPEIGSHNDFIVLLFEPSAYFDGFPRLGDTPPCRTHRDCPSAEVCMMNNFREMDAPTCTVPRPCTTEADCRLGQQCEPLKLASGREMRACHGQPAPEVEP